MNNECEECKQKDLESYLKLQRIQEAARAVASIPCSCDYCWTSRGQHNPRGCTWEDTKTLREILESNE